VVAADIDTPDRIAWGLSFRQLAILAVPVGSLWAVYSRYQPLLPRAVWAALAIPTLAVAVTVALGRRDGLPLDVWIRHGLTLRAVPSPAVPGSPGRGRPLVRTVGKPVVPAPLRPQVTRIGPDGTLTVDGATRLVIACGTTGLGLRTGSEQTALLAGFGRWLNALTGAAQIVACTVRHDLTPHAEAVADAAARLPHPALRAAADDHAAFLLELDATREPLRRQVVTVLPGHASRKATVRGLTALGVTATPLDGGQLAACLAGAVDPYQPPVPGPRAVPGVPVTARTIRP
jgi:hypothetical protein